MTFLKLSAITLAVLSVSACVDNTTTKVAPVAYSSAVSPAGLDLIIAQAKAEERERIMQEIGRQTDLQKRFAYIRMLQLEKRIKPVSVNDFSKLQASFIQKSTLDSAGKVAIKHCQVYQTIPEDYKGSLPAVLNKSTKIRGNKQLLPSLCRSSRSPELVQRLQLALEVRGFLKPSPPNDLVVVDGIWGPNTLSALRAYQAAEGLAYGQVSIESLVSLGLMEVAFETKGVDSEKGFIEKGGSKASVDKKSLVDAATAMGVEALSTDRADKKQFTSPEPSTKLSKVSTQCRVYQVIPEPYRGSLEAVINKSTKIRGNKQLLPILCRSERSALIISELQKRLVSMGYLKPSPPNDLVVIDGIWGLNTLSALTAYQKERGLAYGQLSLESLVSLGLLDVNFETRAIKTESVPASNYAHDTLAVELKTVTKPIIDPIVPISVGGHEEALHAPESLLESNFKIESAQPDVLKRSGTVYRKCWNYQVIPDNYRGSLEAVIHKTTKIRGNKQLLPSLCKSDRSAFIISELQKALVARGYLKPSPPNDLVVIDGIWGENTLSAIKRYQQDHGLAYGQLSIEVMRHLEIPDFMPDKNPSAVQSSAEQPSQVTESARDYTNKGEPVEVMSIEANQHSREKGVSNGVDL